MTAHASYVYDRRIRTLLRELIGAGQEMHAALDGEGAILPISDAEKKRRALRWKKKLMEFRGIGGKNDG